MKKYVLLVGMIIAILLSGCSKNQENSVTEVSQEEDDLLAEFEEYDESVIESSGLVGFGFLNIDKTNYIYDGEAVRIPYYIENMGNEKESNAEIGLLFFVDGEPQPYSIQEGEEKLTEERVMQTFELAVGERREFEIVFHPVAGKKGETIGIIPATIWNPDFVPKDEASPKFGNCLSLSANIPNTIQMECDGKSIHTCAEIENELLDIPQEILDIYEGVSANDVYDLLDGMVGFSIEASEEKKTILYAENGKVDVTIDLYGGLQVTDKITVFINNEPVKINEGDYIMTSTKKGKMCQMKCSLDVSQYERLNTIYAIAMTCGDDYKVQDIYKTDTLLLVNDKGETEKQTKKNSDNSYISLDYDVESGRLVLSDLRDGKEIKSLEVEDTENILETYRLQEGYAVAKVSSSEAINTNQKQDIVIQEQLSEEQVAGYEIIFYDEDLKVVDTIELMEVFPISIKEEILNVPPVISQNGTKAAWNTSEGIFWINLETKEGNNNAELFGKDIVPFSIAFVGDEKIAFTGDKGVSESDSCYGYIDLTNEKVVSYVEENYEATCIFANERFLWLNDGEDPRTGSSSGKVVILDCEANENKVIELDGLESTMARVSDDGKYVIAVNQSDESSFRVRHYDFETGEVLGEKNYPMESNIRVTEIVELEDVYGIVMYSDIGKEMECYETGVE